MAIPWPKLTLVLAAAAAGVGAAAWLHPETDGADLWWHLAAGRWIVSNGAIPLQDPFSHTVPGEAWSNHEWLWGALAWLAYDTSPDLLAWLNLSVALAIFALVGLRAFDLSGSWLAACLVTWLAAAASHWFVDVRPHLVTLLFTALLLVALQRRWSPWLWPALMLAWGNLHAGFIFGVGVMGLHVGIESLRAWRAGGRLPLREWLVLALAVAAVGLNPFGFALYVVPFDHLPGLTPFGALLEWQPVEWSLDPASYAGRFLWLALLSLSGFWRCRRDPVAVALVLLTFVMVVESRRFVPLFAVVAAPVAACGMAALFARAGAHLRLPAWGATAGAAAMLLVALSFWSQVRFTPEPLRRWTLEESAPGGAVAYLAGMQDPPQRLLNAYEWGGYVSLFAPGVPIFIDGRASTLYPDALVEDYHTLVRRGPAGERSCASTRSTRCWWRTRRRWPASCSPRSHRGSAGVRTRATS